MLRGGMTTIERPALGALVLLCAPLACTEPQRVPLRPPPDITVVMPPANQLQVASNHSASPSSLQCDGVLAQDGSTLYCFDTGKRTWTEAEEHCRLIGGHLADIRSITEASLIRAAFGQPFNLPGTLWIGLVEPFKRNEWGWMSGDRALYQNWNAGEPNDSGGGEDCGERLSSNGTWNDIDCAAQRGFICEGPPVPLTRNWTPAPKSLGFKCSGIAVQAEQIPYCLYIDRAMSLADADRFCKANGGKVAEPSTAEKDRALAEQIGPRGGGSGADVWIGLTDAEQEGTWRTAEGNVARFMAFRSGEPNNAGASGEDCAVWSPGDGQWNDLPCDVRAESICRGDAGPPVVR